jgi:hypothetical protein
MKKNENNISMTSNLFNQNYNQSYHTQTNEDLSPRTNPDYDFPNISKIQRKSEKQPKAFDYNQIRNQRKINKYPSNRSNTLFNNSNNEIDNTRVLPTDNSLFGSSREEDERKFKIKKK